MGGKIIIYRKGRGVIRVFHWLDVWKENINCREEKRVKGGRGGERNRRANEDNGQNCNQRLTNGRG